MKNLHWPRLLAAPLIAAAVLLSGCASSGPTGASWPGITVADQNIYLAYHKIYAVTPDGKMDWYFPHTLSGGQAFFAPPAVSGDMVVVTDYTDTVFALNRSTGETLWLFKSNRARFVGSAVITDKFVYAATVDGIVHALNKSDGTQAWFFSAEGPVWATPLLDGDTLYIVSLDRHLYALNAGTGDLKWKFPENPADAGDPPMGPLVTTPTLQDGVLYFGSFNYHVYALDTASRKVLWSYDTTNWVWSSPVYDEESKLLIGADLDGHIFALHPDDGTVAWKYDAKAPVVGAPLLSTREDGSRVAVITVGATLDGATNLLVLKTDDGSSVTPPDSIKATFSQNFLFIPLGTNERTIPMYAPAVAADKLLLVGAHEGDVQIYALDSESLDRKWEFNSAKQEEAAKAATAPPDQGLFGSGSPITQILPIVLIAMLVFILFGQRRGPGGK